MMTCRLEFGAPTWWVIFLAEIQLLSTFNDARTWIILTLHAVLKCFQSKEWTKNATLFVATGWHRFSFRIVCSRIRYVDTKHNQLKRWHYVPREISDAMKWNTPYINGTIATDNVKCNKRKVETNCRNKSAAAYTTKMRIITANDTTKSSFWWLNSTISRKCPLFCT